VLIFGTDLLVRLPNHRLKFFSENAMAYPTPTFHRSDSQAGFYTQTQQQGSSTSSGQQGQPSPPRFESRSSSSSTSNQSRLSEFYGDDFDDDWEDQELENAKATVRQIRVQIRSICDNREFNIDGLITLFEQIKKSQTQRELSRVRANDPDLLKGLSDPLYQLIKKLDDDLQSDEKLVASFSAEDIHSLFNGLSAIVGESVSESLLLKPHFNKLRDSLRQITETLLEHAIDQDFLQKHWDSSSLINALNWISRGLKKDILSNQSPILSQAFTQALMIMKDWASSAGGTAATLLATLDTRQLGKCMVQVNTARKYGLVTEYAPDHLLRDVVLGLCGGNALTQCTLWRQGSDSSQRNRVLTSVLPEGTEITNISNTVKDCLKDGILRLEDRQVQSIIQALCGHMNVIPEAKLLERQGQRLGNCSNFLREIFECEHEAAQPVLQDRVAYEKACKRILNQMPRVSPVVLLSTQSIANLFSFVKAMDRTRRQPTEVLRGAASILVSQLQTMREEMKDADSVAATLGGLQHFALRGLTPPGPAVDQMISLINGVVLNDLAKWEPKSRSALMQAAVHCWQNLADRRTPLPQHHLLEVMQRLLALSRPVTERYHYLMAAAVLIKQDRGWLENHQSVLIELLPAKADAPISEDDVQRAVTQLKASEPVIETLPEPQPLGGSEEKFSGAQKAVATAAPTTTEAGAGKTLPPRVPVGMTRMIEPVKKTTTTTTTTNTTTTTTTTTTTSTKPVSALINTPVESWRSPNRVAKVKQREMPVLTSTEPMLVVRDKPAPEKKQATEKKVVSEKTTPPRVQKGQSHPVTKAPSAINKNSKLTPEQEWFQLLKQEKSLSRPQQQRLQTLLKGMPKLASSSEGKGPKARSALFFALSTGKAEAVSLIMRANAQAKQDIAGTLRQVFDEVLIVGDSEASALKACLSMQSASELAVLRDALNQQYKPGEMRKKVAGKLWEVLLEKGLTQEANVAIDNQIQPQGTAKTTKNVTRAEPVTTQSSAPDPFDRVDEYGDNALMIAAGNGNTDDFQSLMFHESGVEQMKAVNKEKWNVLMLAAYGGHIDIVELLMCHPLRIEQLSATQSEGFNALMIAAQRGHAAVVELLMNNDSGVEQMKTVKGNGRNALMIAAEKGNTDVVKLLIAHPSGVEQAKMVAKNGWNTLMIAAENGRTEVVKYLIAHTSGTQQAMMVNKDGINALMIAAAHNRTEVVKLLIDHPSGTEQAKMVDVFGKNALMIANENGHQAIVDLLAPLM
jgi:ankyrin repeat protein